MCKLIVCKNCVCVPAVLQKHVVTWHHKVLCHPGETHTELATAQHHCQPVMRKTVEHACGTCNMCQGTEQRHLKHSKPPDKEAEQAPWITLHVDSAGPHKIKGSHCKKHTLWACTVIDPATGWFETKEVTQLPMSQNKHGLLDILGRTKLSAMSRKNPQQPEILKQTLW